VEREGRMDKKKLHRVQDKLMRVCVCVSVCVSVEYADLVVECRKEFEEEGRTRTDTTGYRLMFIYFVPVHCPNISLSLLFQTTAGPTQLSLCFRRRKTSPNIVVKFLSLSLSLGNQKIQNFVVVFTCCRSTFRESQYIFQYIYISRSSSRPVCPLIVLHISVILPPTRNIVNDLSIY